VRLIDEQGRVFGGVNLVDGLVVLVVLAVVVAGLAFVSVSGGTDRERTETRYATLSLGDQPPYVATLVTAGDIDNTSGEEVLKVTDVYAVDAEDGQRLYARVEITGPVKDGRVEYAGDPLRVGRSLSVTTADYEISGTITRVDPMGPTLPIDGTDVLLRTTLSAETATAIERGDEYRVGNRTVGRVRSVTAYLTGNGATRTYVGITYRTYRTSAGPRFGAQMVREGTSLPFETDSYRFQGEVVRRGALTQSGRATMRTVTLEVEDVNPDLASSLGTGMTETVRGVTVARVTDLRVEPATVVLTSQDGHVYRREHPVNRDITIVARLRVRETAMGSRFKGEILRYGEQIVVDLGSVTIEPTVVQT
jgi:hypothetical protein